MVSGEESEGEEDGEEGASGDRVLKMKQAMLEEEKQALLQNKDMLEEVCIAHHTHAFTHMYLKSLWGRRT